LDSGGTIIETRIHLIVKIVGRLTKTAGELTKMNGYLTKTVGQLTKMNGHLTKTAGELIKTNGRLTKTNEKGQFCALQGLSLRKDSFI
jgi:hypothetical protein